MHQRGSQRAQKRGDSSHPAVAGDGLRKIGEQFQMDKYRSVGSVLGRMKALLAKNRRPRGRV